MKVVKNKVAAPFKVVFCDILFGSGIDSLGCMLDAANELDIVVRKGSWYSYKDSNFAQVRECEYPLHPGPLLIATSNNVTDTSLFAPCFARRCCCRRARLGRARRSRTTRR